MKHQILLDSVVPFTSPPSHAAGDIHVIACGMATRRLLEVEWVTVVFLLPHRAEMMGKRFVMRWMRGIDGERINFCFFSSLARAVRVRLPGMLGDGEFQKIFKMEASTRLYLLTYICNEIIYRVEIVSDSGGCHVDQLKWSDVGWVIWRAGFIVLPKRKFSAAGVTPSPPPAMCITFISKQSTPNVLLCILNTSTVTMISNMKAVMNLFHRYLG